jgi:choline dehydrogenase
MLKMLGSLLLAPLVATLVAGGHVAQSIEEAAATTYDYIVVGSGPGGGPLACNLARAGNSVLLIEAGDDQYDNPEVSDIGNFIAASNDPNLRWDFWVKHSENVTREREFEHYVYRRTDGSFYIGTNPPKTATPLGIWYPRTATLGGCAMHNAGICQVPPDDDWNHIVCSLSNS